jgi:cyclase
MRIPLIRSLLLAIVAVAAMAASAGAQGQRDFSKVEIKTTKISDNLYTLEGEGGRIGVLAGPDGVLMVDSEFAPLTDRIVAAVRQISDKPIRFLINTHVHGDHTGGNANLGRMGVLIFAREELRNRLMHPAPGANYGAAGMPAPAAALPVVTYRGRVTFHLNGEDVELIPVPRAHTDGDTMVWFHNNDAIMTGDFFRSIQFPNIDRTNGGSLNGMLNGLGTVIGMAGPETKIIPGHGPICDRTAVMAHRDMLLAIRDRVAKLVEQGKTQEEVIAAKPAADYEAKVSQIGTSEDRFIGQLYAELQPAK